MRFFIAGAVGIVLLALAGMSLFIYLRGVSGGYTESANHKARVAFLKCLHSFAAEYKKSHEGEVFDLYHIARENEKYLFGWRIFVPPRRADDWREKGLEDFLESPEKFYKLCQYRLLSCDDGWWAIVEMEMGAKGRYFLMIDKDGNIEKLNEPVLPRQKGAHPERNTRP